MKTIDLTKDRIELDQVLTLARREPVLLITADGKEFILSEADDFEREVKQLRSSEAFHRFLDSRSRDGRRIPLEEIEREIGEEV